MLYNPIVTSFPVKAAGNVTSASHILNMSQPKDIHISAYRPGSGSNVKDV